MLSETKIRIHYITERIILKYESKAEALQKRDTGRLKTA
jgi:hypothetical protein